jgi:hypothetical protein
LNKKNGWHVLQKCAKTGQDQNNHSLNPLNRRPLKVENHLDFLACRWCATYHWNNKNYIFLFFNHQIILSKSISIWLKSILDVFPNVFTRFHFSTISLGTNGTTSSTHVCYPITLASKCLSFYHTSHAIYSFYWNLLICFSILYFLSSLHLTRTQTT